jgi:hypothetical protein
LLFCASFFALFFLRFLAFFAVFFRFFHAFFLCAFTPIFASHSRAQTATKAPGTNLWLLLSLIATESVQESTEKIATPCCDDITSIHTYKTKCREKIISFKVPVFMDNEGSA